MIERPLSTKTIIGPNGLPMEDRRQERRMPATRDPNLKVIKLISGNCYVTDKPNHMIVTILGSCVAACIRDPIAKVGGMNHFLLPENSSTESSIVDSDAMRYGAFAMEQLLNEIFKRGGRRDRLEIKLFGGGNVIKSSAMIGTKNAQFVKKFLRDEELAITTEDLGGTYPRRIHYYPDTGRVMMRALKRNEDMSVAEEEKHYAQQISKKSNTDNVDLF